MNIYVYKKNMEYTKSCQYFNDTYQDNHVFRINHAQIQTMIQQELKKAIQEHVKQQSENKDKTETITSNTKKNTSTSTNITDPIQRHDAIGKNTKNSHTKDNECNENTRVCSGLIHGEEHDEKIDSLLLFAADMVKKWLGYDNNIKYMS